MANVANFKQEYLPQSWEHLKASRRPRISVWIGLAAFVGWVLSRLLPRKRPTYVSKTNQEANYRSGEIKSNWQVQATKRPGRTVIAGGGTAWSSRNQPGATLFQVVAFYAHC